MGTQTATRDWYLLFFRGEETITAGDSAVASSRAAVNRPNVLLLGLYHALRNVLGIEQRLAGRPNVIGRGTESGVGATDAERDWGLLDSRDIGADADQDLTQSARLVELKTTRDDDDVGTEQPAASRAVLELVDVADGIFTSSAVEQPLHMTQNIAGPEDVNRFGVSMDFDMTVLWVAAWYRRDSTERTTLLETLRNSRELLAELGSEERVEAWVSDLKKALNSAFPENSQNPKPLSLEQLSELIKRWNKGGCALRDQDGNDLLAQLSNEPVLADYLIILLVDEQKRQTIFTNKYDECPGWTALNLLRHWTTVGREDRVPVKVYGPRVSKAYLKGHMAVDPLGEK